MVAYQCICDACGVAVYVPRTKPEGMHGQMSEAALASYLAAPSQWNDCGDTFSAAESRILEKMTSGCACGGSLVSEFADAQPLRRCPGCGCTELTESDIESFLD